MTQPARFLHPTAACLEIQPETFAVIHGGIQLTWYMVDVSIKAHNSSGLPYM